jgi:hypothetical protein
MTVGMIVGVSQVCYAFPKNPLSDASGYCWYSLKTPCNVQCNGASEKVEEGEEGVICPQQYACYKAWFYVSGSVLCIPLQPCFVSESCTCWQVPSSPTPGQ